MSRADSWALCPVSFWNRTSGRRSSRILKQVGLLAKFRTTFVPLSLLLIWFNAILVGCVSSSIPSESIGKLSAWRSEAEQWASRLKGDYGKETQQYKRSESLYIPAKAAFDAWIDQLEFNLAAGKDLESSKEYQASFQDAFRQSQAFIGYVRNLYEPGFTPAAAAVLLGPITDWIVKIWTEYQKSEKSRRDEIKKELDSLKWKTFRDISSG